MLILCLGFLSLTAFAQEEKQKTSVRLGLLFPELIVEMQNAEASSFKMGVGIMLAGEYRSENGETTKNTIETITHFNFEPRFFVSRKRRLAMNKSIDNFSGGYIGIPATVYLSKGYSVGALYGTQGTLGRRKDFFYNLGIGVGYVNIELEQNDDIQGADLLTEATIGFRLK